MCYEYSLRKKALKEEMENRKETVSMGRKVNAWILEAKKALIANRRSHRGLPEEAPSRVRERMVG
jgi:hypothetical protein